jgi:hypothetical protein
VVQLPHFFDRSAAQGREGVKELLKIIASEEDAREMMSREKIRAFF